MNLGTFRTAIVFFLMLMTVVFLARTYWTDIVTTLGESMAIIIQARIRYFVLAFLVYLLSVLLFAVRWQKVLISIGYKLKAADLVPVIFGGIFANNLTPASRAGGEPLRIFWINRKFGINYTDGFKSIIFEILNMSYPLG